MELLTAELRKSLPALYSQENKKDPVAHIKFFTPDSNWTWYVTEGSEEEGEFIFFGYVVGFEKEWGYFALSELEAARGPFGLGVERDLYFAPIPVEAPLFQFLENEIGDWMIARRAVSSPAFVPLPQKKGRAVFLIYLPKYFWLRSGDVSS